jgi:capsular polysaccharide export protein
MLVAGTLILYPIYISRTTGQFTTPERALDELLAWRAEETSGLPWWSNAYRFVVGRILRRP